MKSIQTTDPPRLVRPVSSCRVDCGLAADLLRTYCGGVDARVTRSRVPFALTAHTRKTPALTGSKGFQRIVWFELQFTSLDRIRRR